MLWEFDILPAPASQPVPPQDPDADNNDLDQVLPPIDLHRPALCNCYLQPTSPLCLVDISAHRMSDEDSVVDTGPAENVDSSGKMNNGSSGKNMNDGGSSKDIDSDEYKNVGIACLDVDNGRAEVLSQCKGQIQVIYGPMFSGKTTELMRRIKRYQIANHSCLLIRYDKDVRYDEDRVSTHDQQKMPAMPCHELSSIKSKAMKFNIIGIDEGQFFPDLVEFCEELANEGKTIIVAALDGTYQRKVFGNVLNLIPLAENVIKLNAVCMYCFKDAAFTKRLGDEQKVEIIGGAELYWPVCRECFRKCA